MSLSGSNVLVEPSLRFHSLGEECVVVLLKFKRLSYYNSHQC